MARKGTKAYELAQKSGDTPLDSETALRCLLAAFRRGYGVTGWNLYRSRRRDLYGLGEVALRLPNFGAPTADLYIEEGTGTLANVQVPAPAPVQRGGYRYPRQYTAHN